MYLRDLITSLGRRWYLVLVGISATVGIALLAYNTVPVSYDARASMVLLPPATSVDEGGNPYLYLSGLGQALDILSRRLDSDVVRSTIEDGSVYATYVAAPDVTTSGPILAIEGSGESEEAALTVLDDVVDAVDPALSSLQTELNIPDYSRITAMTITVDTEATLNQKTRLQATLALGGVALAATVLLTGFVDGRLVARQARLTEPPEPVRRPARRRRENPSVAAEDETRDSSTPESNRRYAPVKRGDPTNDAMFAPRK